MSTKAKGLTRTKVRMPVQLDRGISRKVAADAANLHSHKGLNGGKVLCEASQFKCDQLTIKLIKIFLWRLWLHVVNENEKTALETAQLHHYRIISSDIDVKNATLFFMVFVKCGLVWCKAVISEQSKCHLV